MNSGGGTFDNPSSYSATIAGPIAGTGSLTKTGTGTLTLSAANSYNGNTIITAGTLALGASGSLNAGSSVSIAAGATFDVSANTGPSGTYTWGSSAGLTASGSATTSATILSGSSATVNLSSRSITLNMSDTNHPALVVSQGSLNLAGATIAVNNNGTALGAGDYTVISGGVTGTPATTVVSVGGTGGLVGSATATLSVSGGNLSMHVSLVTGTSLALTRTAGSSPSTYGDSLTFHVVVTPDPGNGSTITFKTNGTAFGTATTSGGVANLTLSTLPYSGGAAYTVNASYPGDGVNFSGSSSNWVSAQQVNQKALTITSATAQSKRFDGNTTATVSGTLVGVMNGDGLTLSSTGDFASAGPATGISVTFSVTGITANYSLTQPGVTANIYDAPVWNGGSGTGNNWSDAANWDGLTLLANDKVSFAGTTRLNNTNNTTAGTTYSNINFNAGAGAFVLNGNPIALAGNITNSSSSVQTVNLGLNFGAGSTNLTLDGGTGGLIIGGGLTNAFGAPGWTVLTLAGTGTLTNLLGNSSSPGGTNLITLNSPSANWTLADNASAKAISIPWIFAVNNGTFNFGTAGSAPVLTLANVQTIPSEANIGSGSGNTATFNMVNGALTNIVRVNTGATAGATGNISVSGGLWAMNGGLQNANGTATSGGNISVSGGTLHVPNQNIYVASRGAGTLNVSSSGKVLCNTLDVSRGAAAGSQGVVNLNGGTLAVNLVSAGSANSVATNGSETATFNFNGGTLQARQNNSNFITQSGVAFGSNIVINAFVKSGGAVIDTAGFSVTNAHVLQHDSALGGTPDGGLTKLGLGILALAATNTYTGNTTVSNGTLLVNALDFSPITVASGGTLGGIGVIGAAVTNNGIIAPGANAIGTLTFSNAPVLNGTVLLEINSASAQTADILALTTGTLAKGGTLTVTNRGAVPAVGTTFVLFSAPAFSGSFAATNLPAGGEKHWKLDYPAVGSLLFTNNAPAASNFNMNAVIGIASNLQIIGGKYAPSDPDSDALTVTGVTGYTNATVTFTTTNITYTPTNGGADHFTYTVSDGLGGTATATVNVTVLTNGEGFNRLSPPTPIGGGTVVLSYVGVQNYPYALDWATNLTAPINWMPVITNTTDTNGLVSFTNTSAEPANFFRTRQP